ncbi:MAG: transporter permease [Proteobacteria bacterium]|nr:transporter permease [Pseudomonadota bacterium]
MIGLHRRPRLELMLLLLPGAGFLAALFGFPLLTALLGSFGLVGDDPALTLKFYARIFTSTVLLRSLATSLYYGVVPVAVTVVLAIVLALALRRHFAGRKLFNGLYKIPLKLPKMVRDPWGIGVIAATTWKQLPFMTLVITGAFAAIPEDIRHAARTLGAGPIRAFLRIELPLALPGITAAVLLTFIGSMGSFAIPDLVGAPNPLPLSVRMVRAFAEGDMSQVFAIGMVLSAFAFAVLIGYYALTSRVGTAKGDSR